ncbi:response regulator [Sphingomonas koreensis]|nr:response regulator [Sphingomonas koreensis]
MLETFNQFISGRYEPHGYCLLWQPALIWTHVISDGLIAAAYFSIPLALVRLVKRRTDITFGWMIWLFALFILACGATHLMGIWNLWHGDYGVEALVKAITAAASVPTAILLWRLIPQALAIASPTQLQEINDQLRVSVAARDTAVARLQSEIAQRERAEAALVQAQKMDAIGQLTGGIAHDFNNLLQAVGGNLDLIRSHPENPEKIARWITNASSGVARGTKLARQLLAFSRTQRLELRPVELNALIHGMRELLASSLGALVRYELDLEPELCHVCGDATQLELVILNLAINARDAMPQGGTLRIATRSVTLDGGDGDLPAGDFVELAIIDTGTGMPPEVAARAMDPFFTTKEVGAGTGLGLSMAFGVATQSGGTLRLQSIVGEGTRITLLLPCTAAKPASVPATRTTAAVSGDGVRGRPIAIIDDDLDVRTFVSDCLTAQGAVCQIFENGETFLAQFENSNVELVLLDFAMPGLSGAEVARRIRLVDPQLPVVIMTGYADSASLDEILGDVRVIRKPFSADALLRAVGSGAD